MFSIGLFFRVALAGLVITITLFDRSAPADRNQLNDVLYKLSEWFLYGPISYGN